MGESSALNEIKGRVQRILKEKIVQVLIENSFLTETQLETLLLDFHARAVMPIKLKTEQIAGLRDVARGSFSRVLHQGRRNFIKAAYTIILLNYLGFYDKNPFNLFVGLNEKILEYAQKYDSLWEEQDSISKDDKRRRLETLEKMKNELNKELEDLAKPMFSFKE